MKKFRSLIAQVVFFTWALFLSGCVSEQSVRLTDEDAHSLKGRSLVTTIGNPTFSVVAPGGAAMPLSDIASVDASGGQIIKVPGVLDPAIRIGGRLADYLEAKRAMVIKSKGNLEEKSTVESLASVYGSADYVLDVRTKIWDVRSTSAESNKYFIAYAAVIRLIDTREKKILAQGICRRTKPQPGDSASLDKLRRDEGAELKAEIMKVEDYCIDLAKRDILPR